MKPLTENSVLEPRGLPDPRSRTSAKRERESRESALISLAEDLVQLSLPRLESLGVPDAVLAALEDAKKIKAHAARARQMRQVRARLRDADWIALRSRLDQLRAGVSVSQEDSNEADLLVEQLLVAGDAALVRMVSAYPDADRHHLRTLVRNHHKSTPGKRTRTRDALLRVVRGLLEASAAQTSAAVGTSAKTSAEERERE